MFRKVIKSHVARRRVSWIIAAVLILPFILFFHATGQNPPPGPGGLAGTLFGRPVPWDTFQAQHLWLRRQLETRLGAIPEGFEPQLVQLTWDRLMMLAEAKRQRLRVGDGELAAFLQQIPAFQDAGRFWPPRYREFLRLSGTSPQAFEALVRDDLLTQKLQETLEPPIPVTDDELRAAFTERYEQLTASVIVIDAGRYLAQVRDAILEPELRTHYERSLDDYRTPAQFSLEYAGASSEELAGKVEVIEQDVRTFYEQHPDRYPQDGGVKPFDAAREAARQDFVAERVRGQLAALAVDLETDLKAESSFEDIVTARALNAQSAGPFPVGTRGGPGAPDPALLEAAVPLREGELSDVIETDRGVYLVRVTERTPEGVQPFEEVRERVHDALAQQRASTLAKEAAQALHARLTAAMAGGLRLEEAAMKEGVTLIRPPPFSRTQSVDPIGAGTAFNAAAFQTPLGHLSEVLETSSGFAIARTEERLPADAAMYPEVESSLRQDLALRKRAEHYSARLTALRQRAKLQNFIETDQ